MNYEQEIDVLKRQMLSLRRQVQAQEEWLDTVNSPLYKRVWWWVGGYKFFTVGRWYGEDTKRFRVWLFIAKLIRCT